MRFPKSGGGWQAIRYTWKKSREVGGITKLWKAMRSKNACKTCAVGMGGQKGGMVNERGSFPEVCKKSLQAMAADMQPGIQPDFWATTTIDQLRQMTPQQLEYSGRLIHPVRYRQGDKHYEPITWSAAFSAIADKLKAISPDESFFYFSGRSSNEAGFLLQLFARLYGTNNVNNCSYYCHQASGVGLTSSIGSGTASIVLEDVEHADVLFVIGGNPASNHPRLMTTMKNIRRKGGQIVVINPVVETGLVNFKVPSDPISLLFGTKIASLYVQPHIGGDLALLTAVAKRIVEMGAHDQTFLNEHCDNADAYLQFLSEQDWSELERKSGIDQQQIHAVADVYAQSKNAVFSWTMGITHHAHGVQNVQAVANLALLRAMVGRPNAGLMPIRGHSNVQGIGSVGVTPQLKEAVFQGLEEHFDVQLPTTKGLDTLACMEASHAGFMRFGLCLGGNLYGSNPDARFAAESLNKLEQVVYLSTTLNTGHAHGVGQETIILPVLARDEEPQPTTQESMFNLVRLSDGGKARHTGPKSEVEIVSRLGKSVLGDKPLDWNELKETGRIRTAIARVIPGWEKIEQIEKTKEEFQIRGRTLHKPVFPTNSGRARLHAYEIPELKGTGNELRLMTVRSEGQFNTVVYEEYDLYRGQERRDVVLVHSEDVQRLGLQHDQLVRIESSVGVVEGFRIRSFNKIRPGNALMYYPEANVLVPRTADPCSKTPAFKGIIIRVTAA